MGMDFKQVAKIMVVDDSEDVRDSLSLMLRQKGFVVEQAANGRQALEKALSFKPDIILMDVIMPVMDGFEACRRLRENVRTKHISLILSTSTVVTNILGRDIDDYIRKPYCFEELYVKIEKALKLREIRD